MIAGVGVALVEPARVERLLRRYGRRFADRVFTAEELQVGPGPRGPERLAVRVAAKLAARGALGAAPGVRLRDFEVVRQEGGAPRLRLHGAAAARARTLGIRRFHLSLTHDPPCAIGQVVAEAP